MISLGDRVFVKGEGLGLVAAVDLTEGRPSYGVRIEGSSAPMRSFSRSRIATRGEIYVGADGKGRDPLSYSEAFQIVLDLAVSNQPALINVDRSDDTLVAQIGKQQVAIDNLDELVSYHAEELDERFQVQLAATTEVIGLIAPARFDTPEDPGTALKLCFDLARQVALDPRRVDGDELLSEQAAKQAQALDTVSDFMKLHTQELRDNLPAMRPAPSF